MAEARIKVIIQKRTSLKTLLTKLETFLNEPELNKSNIKIRLERISRALTEFENLHDEWVLLKPNDDRLAEFEEIQDKYYTLAGQVDEIINPPMQNITVPITNSPTPSASFSATSSRSKNLKLPETQLPKFGGDYNRWLNFKNTFLSMIGARDDLTDVEKFLYLKSSLKGEALGKISIFTISAENYAKAWTLLTSTYEVKKIIVTRHLKGILNLSPIEKETHENITKLIDCARQHVSSLESLNTSFGSEVLAQIIESKLPRHLADK